MHFIAGPKKGLILPYVTVTAISEYCVCFVFHVQLTKKKLVAVKYLKSTMFCRFIEIRILAAVRNSRVKNIFPVMVHHFR